MVMSLENKVNTLHNAKVIDKDSLSVDDQGRIDNLSDEDVTRLIEIADKLLPGAVSPIEISLLF